MRVDHFSYLVTLKKHGSFSKAAQHLYISQPSLSTSIFELEEELGVQLLKRTKKGVSFTDIGEVVLEKAELILNEIETIKKVTRAAEGTLKGNILVGGAPVICGGVLLDVILNMRNNNPAINICFEESDSFDIVKAVGNNRYDIGIIGVSGHEERYAGDIFQENEIEYHELYEDELCCWIGADHPLKDQTAVTLASLKEYPCVSYKNNLSKLDLSVLNQHGAEISEIMHINDLYCLKNYLIKSSAFTLAPKYATMDDIYTIQGFLYPLKIADFPWKVNIGWIRKKRSYTPYVEQEFIKELAIICEARRKRFSLSGTD